MKEYNTFKIKQIVVQRPDLPLDRDMLAWFRKGLDTVAISGRYFIPEFEVYNRIHHAREQERME